MFAQDENSSSLTCTSSSMPMNHPSPPSNVLRHLNSNDRGLYLIHMLMSCATSVAAGAIDQANACLEHIAMLAAPDGDAMQRIASHFTEALARRLLRHWPGVYRAIHPPILLSDAASSVLKARRHLFDLCPLVKLAFLASNYVILEAMEGEKVVHIIDLSGASADASQWVALLEAFSCRPLGPPHLRITMVNEHKQFVDQSLSRLIQEAERLDIPFQFNGVVSRLDALDLDSLPIKSGEVVAITSILEVHSLLRFDVDKRNSSSSPKMDSFLSSLWGHSPKLVVITEQEANHNGLTLMERFTEALNYYAAFFDCLESTVSSSSVERARVEKMIFGEEIKNIISCEGMERKERHEKSDRWAERMENAGFVNVRMMSYYLLTQQQCRRLYGYKVVEDKGRFFLCWQERPLYSISAWNCKKTLKKIQFY